MSISTASTDIAVNHNPLPDSIVEKLVEKYHYISDINARLLALPHIKRGIYVGKMPSASPHDNALQYATKHGIRLYVGYLIEPDRGAGGLKLTMHSFCVDEKRNHVVEPTAGIKWGGSTRYIGIPVAEEDYSQHKYLHRFNKFIL